MYDDMIRISHGFWWCQLSKFIPSFDNLYFKTIVKIHFLEKVLCLLNIFFINFSQIQIELMMIGDDPNKAIAEFNFF